MKIEHFENIVKVSLTDNIYLAGPKEQKFELIAKLLEQHKFITIDRYSVACHIHIPKDQVHIWKIDNYRPNHFIVYVGQNGGKIITAFNSNASYLDVNEYNAIGYMIYTFESVEIQEEWIN